MKEPDYVMKIIATGAGGVLWLRMTLSRPPSVEMATPVSSSSTLSHLIGIFGTDMQ
jgi:hypothetical protein